MGIPEAGTDLCEMEDDIMADKSSKHVISIGHIIYTVAPALSLIILFTVWINISRGNSDLVPSPLMVWERFLRTFEKPINGQLIFGHIFASIKRVFLALLISLGLGIPFGIMIGWNKTFNSIFGTLFELIRPIPPIAWLPLIIMWFGIGELPKVLIVFIGTFTPIVVNTSTGIRLVEPLNLDVGRMFNASQRQLLTEIALPSALPSIFAGFRTATSGGLMVVLAAEMIGAKAGLGFLITRGQDVFDVPLIMVGMLVIAIVGTIVSIITDYLERWVCPWLQSPKSD